MGNRSKDQDSIKSRTSIDEAEGDLTDVDATRAPEHHRTFRARARRAAAVTAVTLGALTMPLLAAQPAMAAAYTCTTDNWNGSVCQSLTPTVNCVWHNTNGSWTAVFGYRNTSSTYDITVPAGILNFMYPGNWNVGQPTYLPRGTVSSKFTATFTGTSESWYLVGKGATATTTGTKCLSPPVPMVGTGTVMLRTFLLSLPLLWVATRTRRIRGVAARVPTVFRSAA
jgi:hypothetical protein